MGTKMSVTWQWRNGQIPCWDLWQYQEAEPCNQMTMPSVSGICSNGDVGVGLVAADPSVSTGAELLHKELALTDVAEKWSKRGGNSWVVKNPEAGLIWNVCGSHWTLRNIWEEVEEQNQEFVPTKWMGVKTGRGCLVIFTVTLSLPSLPALLIGTHS